MNTKRDKSYNDLMNEWASKHSMLRKAGGIGGGSAPGKIWAWLWRTALCVGIPAGIYAGILKFHASGTDFNKQLEKETEKYLGAESVKFRNGRWDLGGEVRVQHMEIKGGPQNIFSSAEILNFSGRMPMPDVFKSEWTFKGVQAVEATVALRSGGKGQASASAGSSSAEDLLTAGWGISPDGGKIRIDGFGCSKTKLTWGASPSTFGEIAEAAVRIVRKNEKWELVTAGGVLRQGWLDNLRVTDGGALIGPQEILIKGALAPKAGGEGQLAARIVPGEVPTVEGGILLKAVPFHLYLPEMFQTMVNVECDGEVKLSGSTNSSGGIVMEAKLNVKSGRIAGIPVFRALEIASGQTGLALPEFSAGHIHFSSKGLQDSEGLLVEADDVLLEAGTNVQVGLTVKHESRQTFTKNIRTVTKEDEAVSKDVTTTGTIKIGLPHETVAKMKPTIQKEFFTRDERGYLWLDYNFDLAGGEFTQELADRIIALHHAK